MIAVALEILRRVVPTGQWDRSERDVAGAAANMAQSIQAAEQRSQLQAAANADPNLYGCITLALCRGLRRGEECLLHR